MTTFRGISFDETGTTDEASIASLEHRLGVTLPADYRQFLSTVGGGRPVTRDVFATADGVINGIRKFITLDGEYGFDYTLMMFADRVPDVLLPIGRDSGGNLICLQVRGDRVGTVFFWKHNFEAEEDEPPTWDNLTYVAPSFSALLDGLRQG